MNSSFWVKIENNILNFFTERNAMKSSKIETKIIDLKVAYQAHNNNSANFTVNAIIEPLQAIDNMLSDYFDNSHLSLKKNDKI